jgi:hypothetical protein
MHGLDTLIRRNTSAGMPEFPGQKLRKHPRIIALRRDVAGLPVDEHYRRWLYRSINRYADQIIERPSYAPEDGWDDLEALQQVTLGDMMEFGLREVCWRGG